MEERDIYRRLKEVRIEHNLKQEDVAKVLGIERSAYSGYETGRTRISVMNLCRLASVYNMKVDQLIGRDDDSQLGKVRNNAVSSGIDPIAMLERDEQIILMYFRLADEKRKKEIMDYLVSKAENDESEEQ